MNKTCEVMVGETLCGQRAVLEIKLPWSSQFRVCKEHLEDFDRDGVIESKHSLTERETKPVEYVEDK